VLFALWSPKGGSGTSVIAATCALVLARDGDGARLADIGGDQPAIFGLAADPETGIVDWLATGPEAPADALERLAVTVAAGVALIPRGSSDRSLAPLPAAESGAALAVALRDGPVPTIVDAGLATAPAARALVEVADVSVVVLRGCYLALRRAVHSPLLARATGIVLVEEGGRSLGPSEVRDVVDRPVLARVPVRPPIARAVDAGVLAARLPDALARPAARLLSRVGLRAEQRGEAA
jgi:MinD-like ATPase involved in chromosome partitioning or flagellar assembly